jgi:hypothetical protein
MRVFHDLSAAKASRRSIRDGRTALRWRVRTFPIWSCWTQLWHVGIELTRRLKADSRAPCRSSRSPHSLKRDARARDSGYDAYIPSFFPSDAANADANIDHDADEAELYDDLGSARKPMWRGRRRGALSAEG